MRKTFRHPKDPEASLFLTARNRRCRVKRRRQVRFIQLFATKAQKTACQFVPGFYFWDAGFKNLYLIFNNLQKIKKTGINNYAKDLPASARSGSVYI